MAFRDHKKPQLILTFIAICLVCGVAAQVIFGVMLGEEYTTYVLAAYTAMWMYGTGMIYLSKNAFRIWEEKILVKYLDKNERGKWGLGIMMFFPTGAVFAYHHWWAPLMLVLISLLCAMTQYNMVVRALRIRDLL